MTTVSEIFETMAYGPAPESDKQAREWLEKHAREFGLFIGGRWVKGESGESFDVLNPATTERLARVTQAGPGDVDAAVAAARRALPGWSGLAGHARARHLYALGRALQRHSRLLAVLESLDNGKSIRETRDLDIPLVARHFYHHAGWAQLVEAEFPGQRPVGVVGQIIPWNFPLLMVAWKVAPALAAGVLRGVAAARARGRRRAAARKAARAHGKAARRPAARQGDRHGRDRRAGAARPHPHARWQGRGGRRHDVAAVVGMPHRRLLLPTDAVHERVPGRDDRAGRDLRPRARLDDVPHPRRSGRAREQHTVRARGERVDGERQPGARRRAEDQSRRRVDQLHQPVRRGVGVRGLSGVRLRAGGWTRGDVGVLEAEVGNAERGSENAEQEARQSDRFAFRVPRSAFSSADRPDL